jgi:hypothetical protein
MKYSTSDKSWAEPDKYGIDYEDDRIMLHHDIQHYDCTCHVEKEDMEWQAAHPHRRNCFVSVAKTLEKRIDKRFPLPDSNLFYEMDEVDVAEMFGTLTKEQEAHKSARIAAYDARRIAYCKASKKREAALATTIMTLAKKRGVKIAKKEAAWMWQYRCICGRDAEHHKFEKSQSSHVKPCDFWWGDQPNFLYKPTGFEARWYKYIGRDMAYNRERLSRGEWEQLKGLVTEEQVQAVMDVGRARSEDFERMIARVNERFVSQGRGRNL